MCGNQVSFKEHQRGEGRNKCILPFQALDDIFQARQSCQKGMDEHYVQREMVWHKWHPLSDCWLLATVTPVQLENDFSCLLLLLQFYKKASNVTKERNEKLRSLVTGSRCARRILCSPYFDLAFLAAAETVRENANFLGTKKVSRVHKT